MLRFCHSVPVGLPSRGGYVMVYVLDIDQLSLPTLFILFLCLSSWPFQLNLIPEILLTFLSAFSLCSSGLTSALLVLSTIYLFMKVSLSPDIILCGLRGLKH